MKTNKSEKWSIQISSNLAEYLKQYSKSNGYTMSGFIEQSIKNTMSKIKSAAELRQLSNVSIEETIEKEINKFAKNKKNTYSYFEYLNDLASKGITGYCELNFFTSNKDDAELIINILNKLNYKVERNEDKLSVNW